MGSRITRVRPAGGRNQVVTVEGGRGIYRRSPCAGCPWRVDQTGSFPAEAFAHSADTARDLATQMFGCHEPGTETPMTCAGFLLRGAYHNMAVRMRASTGEVDFSKVHDGGHELHAGYVTMAVENGLDSDDPALRRCRLSPHEEMEG
jgi:hypothetical protein